MAEAKKLEIERKPKHYPDVDGNPDFARLEEKILQFWQTHGTFEESVTKRDKSPEFIFYDGPPFANGLPHYGHLLTGYVKDLFARYQTMKGKKVERRFGWDCHGLPAEMGVEKEIGIGGRKAIEEYGIAKFNDHCRTSVMKYTKEWEFYVNRQARWVDFENDYKTMDLSYMESVMWAFKQLHEKGYVYEDFRVMPYSWAMETPVSNFETKMDNAYRDRTDKAVYVAFELDKIPEQVLINKDQKIEKAFLVAWTTTPWTLPSNLALGVAKPDSHIKYSAHIVEGKCFICSEESGKKLFPNLYKEENSYLRDNSIKVYKNVIGSTNSSGFSLIDSTYKPLFPYFEKLKEKGAFKILSADFIEEGSGTGVVHLAPGFGEDDQRVCKENGIELVCPVDEKGRYTSEIYDLDDLKLQGLNVVADKNKSPDEPYRPEQLEKYGLANLRIIDWLKKHEKLAAPPEDIKHSYPHCWRTDTPLIYRAVSSWYVEVTKFKNRMVELNQQKNRIPEHGKDGRCGKRLEGAQDRSISHNRFCRAPIPVWRSDDPQYHCEKVFGSLQELQNFFNVTPQDLHRPNIDKLVAKNPNDPTGKSMLRRVTDVLDCWFESGSMPFAQVHYPFENKDWFENHFPADFIVEYEAQTRGWFYTLMVLGTALFDKPPFKNVICHGVVLDENGEKLSKSKGNYVDPKEIFNQYGADSLRWLMLSSPIMNGQELYIDKDGKFIRDVVRLYIKPIWNAYNFFTLYANADGIKAEFDTKSENLMDKYIMAKLAVTIDSIEAALDAFDTPNAYRAIEQFFEALNNWYIRRSKNRFWKEEKDQDKQTAYNTLYTCLVLMCRAAAPLIPFITEEIFKGLTGQESVHLADFPDTSRMERSDQMVIVMDRVRDVCNAALAIRNVQNIRVRQPLASMSIVGNNTKGLMPFVEIIKEEINVKKVEFEDDVAAYADFKLQINFQVLGKRLPEKIKQIIPASKKGEWKKLANGNIEIVGEELTEDECFILLEPKDKKGAEPLSTQDALVVLDLNITPELEKEGIARDIVRMIQQARKDAKLNVSDKINLFIEATGDIGAAVDENQDYIKEQTLTSSLRMGNADNSDKKFENELDGKKIVIGLSKAS